MTFFLSCVFKNKVEIKNVKLKYSFNSSFMGKMPFFLYGKLPLGKLSFEKLPLGILHVWEVATWEIVTWEVALGEMLLGNRSLPRNFCSS